MKKDVYYDLEDLSALLECTTDNLLILHNTLEPNDNINSITAYNALYGLYCQLEEITKAIQDRVAKIPAEIIRAQNHS